jgi:hypothetical protein
VALNYWKIGGKPTSYNPLSSGYADKQVSILTGTKYVVTFNASSLSGSAVQLANLTGTPYTNITLTPNKTKYTYEFVGVNGCFIIWCTSGATDIIIDSIELVQKSLPKLTLNGVDGFTSGKWGGNFWSSYMVVDDSTVILNALASSSSCYLTIPCMPNTTYTSSVEVGTYAVFNSDASFSFSGGYRTTPSTFTTGANDTSLRFYLNNYNLPAGQYTFKRPMLVLGSTPVPYSRKTGDKMVLPVAKGDGTYQANKKPKKTTLKARTGLAFNGVSDYLQLPSMTMDSVEIDCLIDSVQPQSNSHLIDARVNLVNGYLTKVANTGSGWSNLFVDGVNKPNKLWSDIPNGQRTKVKLVSASPFSDDVTIFSNNGGSSAYNTKGTVYKITCYLGNQIVAQYDFENPSNIVGASVLQNGINLIPNFEDVRWSLHANTQVLGKHLLRLNASGANISLIDIPVSANTSYLEGIVVSDQVNCIIKLSYLKLDKSLISDLWQKTGVIVTPANTAFIRYQLYNNISGSFDFSKPQLYQLTGNEGTISGAPRYGYKPSRRTQYAKR